MNNSSYVTVSSPEVVEWCNRILADIESQIVAGREDRINRLMNRRFFPLTREKAIKKLQTSAPAYSKVSFWEWDAYIYRNSMKRARSLRDLALLANDDKMKLSRADADFLMNR